MGSDGESESFWVGPMWKHVELHYLVNLFWLLKQKVTTHAQQAEEPIFLVSQELDY